MVEKITVSRDEVVHYSWLDHTWVYIHYTKDEITKTPMFQKALVALLCYGIKATTGKDFQGITPEDGYLFIRYDTDDIVDILKNACGWLPVHVRINSEKPTGQYILEHKERLFGFLAETKKILEEKTYKYYFQSVDGLS